MVDGSLAPYVTRWVTERAQTGEIGQSTARLLSYRFRELVAAHGDRPVSSLDESTILEWRRRIGTQAPATRRAYQSTVSSFCAWLVHRGDVAQDPTLGLPRVREPRQIPRARRPEEVARVLAACTCARDQLIVLLMVGMGLRCIEVAQLEVGDYDPVARSLQVRGKFGDERALPVPIPVGEAISTYLDALGWSAGPLIRSRSRRDTHEGVSRHHISQLVGELMTKADVKRRAHDGAGAHSLRHTAASDVYALCKDPRVVQAMLGHSSLATTQRYLRHVELDELRQAMEGRHYGAAAAAA